MPAPFVSWIAGFALAQVPLPGTSSVSVPLVSSSVCRSCHGDFAPHSAWSSWAGSPMSVAAKDPLYLSALSEAEKDVPGVGDFCLRCHAPEAWLQGRCADTSGGGLLPDDTGVTCSVCHRMEPSTWQRNGQFIVADDLDMRGPLLDPMAPHRTKLSTFIGTSELCGSCHDLRNPLVERRNLDGTPTGQPFPEQTTYTEWRTSAFAAENLTCQSCHFTKRQSQVAASGPVRDGQSSHDLIGGNLFILGAVAFLEPGLGLDVELEAGKLRGRDLMRTAATLSVPELTGLMLGRGTVARVTVRVTNEAGHKLPTGYPEGRRVWLEARSPVLGLEVGRYDQARGEPIDPPVVYQTIQGRYGVGPGSRLAINDAIYFDNRIPPRGFVPTATTAPVGKVYPEVAPGVLAHFDDVTLTATVPCDPQITAATLQLTLWYQSVSKAYVDTLVAANGADPRGARLQAAFEEADPGPLEITRLTASLPIDPASSCAAPDAGFPDSGSSDRGFADTGVAPSADAGSSSDAGVIEEGGCSCRTESKGPRAADGLIGAGLLWMAALCRAGRYKGRRR